MSRYFVFRIFERCISLKTDNKELQEMRGKRGDSF